MNEETRQDDFPGFWQAIGLHVELLIPVLGMSLLVLLLEDVTELHLLEHPGVLGLLELLQLIWLLRRESIRRQCAPDEIGGPWVSRYLWLLPALALIKGFWWVWSPALAWMERTWPALHMERDFGMQISPAGAFVWIVAAGPLFEEFFYRGVILRGFVARYNQRAAVLASSLLFMAVHFYPILYVQTFGMSVLFSWLWLRTRSVWPGVLLHMVNNLLGFVGLASSVTLLGDSGWGLPGVAAGFVLAGAGFLGLRRWAPSPRVTMED